MAQFRPVAGWSHPCPAAVRAGQHGDIALRPLCASLTCMFAFHITLRHVVTTLPRPVTVMSRQSRAGHEGKGGEGREGNKCKRWMDRTPVAGIACSVHEAAVDALMLHEFICAFIHRIRTGKCVLTSVTWGRPICVPVCIY